MQGLVRLVDSASPDGQVKFLGKMFLLGNPNCRSTVRDKFLGLLGMTFGLVHTKPIIGFVCTLGMSKRLSTDLHIYVYF